MAVPVLQRKGVSPNAAWGGLARHVRKGSVAPHSRGGCGCWRAGSASRVASCVAGGAVAAVATCQAGRARRSVSTAVGGWRAGSCPPSRTPDGRCVRDRGSGAAGGRGGQGGDGEGEGHSCRQHTRPASPAHGDAPAHPCSPSHTPACPHTRKLMHTSLSHTHIHLVLVHSGVLTHSHVHVCPTLTLR